jgi:hypothetical protein
MLNRNSEVSPAILGYSTSEFPAKMRLAISLDVAGWWIGGKLFNAALTVVLKAWVENSSQTSLGGAVLPFIGC